VPSSKSVVVVVVVGVKLGGPEAESDWGEISNAGSGEKKVGGVQLANVAIRVTSSSARRRPRRAVCSPLLRRHGTV
jgi:hypothetical protein